MSESIEQAPAATIEGAESTDAAARAFVADEVLLSAVDLARRALLEVAAPETVGSVVGHLVEDEHVLTLLFASDLGGYPGWRWSVTLARVDDGEPTVLETELMPGETALLAPEWVPWSERLAEYRAAQEAAAAAAAEAAGEEGDAEALDDDDEADDDDELDDDDDEFDDDGDDFEAGDDDFEAGDDVELDAAFGGDDGDDEFDGIDIDALDDSADDGDETGEIADEASDADGSDGDDTVDGDARDQSDVTES